MMTSNAVGTLYSQLSPISFSEFTPSRVTRVSNNPYLQEHCPFSSSIVASGVPPNRPRKISSTTPPPTSSNKYVELAFNGTEQTQLSNKDVTVSSTETIEDCYSTIRRYQRPEGSFKPESVLGYTADSLDEEEQEAESKIIRQSLTSTSIHMDRPISFAIAIDENPISIFDIGSPTASTGRVSGGVSQDHLPDDIIASRTSSTTPNTNRQSTEGRSLVSPSSKDESSISIYRNVPVDIPHPLGGHPAAHVNHSRVSAHINDHVPALSSGNTSGNEYYNVVLSDHKVMPSYRRSSSDFSPLDTTCSFSPSGSVFRSNNHHRVPPDGTNGGTNSCSMEDLLHHHHKTIVKPRGSLVHSNSCSTSTPNLPQLLTSASSSSSEESYGRFTVVYLGKMDTDCYTSCIDKCAQKMLDPKSTIPLHTSEVTVDIMSSRIRLMKPTSGMLLVSIPVNDIFTFSQCSKNKRLVGVIVWKRNTIVPVCHLFRCYDQLLSKAFLDSITSVKQDADCLLMEKLAQSDADGKPQSLLTSSLSDSSVGDVLHKWLAVHVATVRLYNKSPISVSAIIKKALSDYRPSQSNSVSLWASLAQVRLVQMVDKKQVIYGQHSIRSMEAIGTGQNDQRLIGYIIREKDKPPIAYVLLCYNLVDAGALVNFLRQACQNDYQLRKGSNLLPHDPLTVEQGGSATASSRKGLLSLFRSIKPVRSNNVSDTDVSGLSSQSVSPLNVTSTSPNLSSSFQSYVSSQQISSSVVSDIPQKRKNCVTQPSPLQSSFDSPEEEFAKFSVTYVGSANLEGPFTSSSIAEALDKFKEGGVAVGMAPIAKNTVTMHVSTLGINLSDKKQKMFINRNYPQKQIIGHCSLLSDPEYFGFATLRPGFKDQVKVHVFTSCDPSTDQILYTMKYWLNITTPSTDKQ